MSSKSNKNKSLVSKSDWYVITKEGCPYCVNAKELLANNNQKYTILKLDDKNRELIYQNVDHLTNKYRYVPMIFKDGKFIGGYDKLKEKFNETESNCIIS
jgi:glutaredoxin